MSKLFSPVKVGPYELAHRVVLAPLTRMRAEDGARPGRLIIESTLIRTVAKAFHFPSLSDCEALALVKESTAGGRDASGEEALRVKKRCCLKIKAYVNCFAMCNVQRRAALRNGVFVPRT